MHGHERDGRLPLARRVEVGAQGEPLHEAGQVQVARHGLALLGLVTLDLGVAQQVLGGLVVGYVLLDHAEELADVLDAVLGLLGALGAQGVDEAALVGDHLNDVGQVALVGLGVGHHLQKAHDTVARLARDPRLEHVLRGRLKERDPAPGRQLGDAVLGRGADGARRLVDDPAGRDVVGGVHGQLEVGREVANLGAVKEARPPHDGVGDAGLDQAVFEHARLGVGAVEERDVAVGGALVVEALDLAGDVVGFGKLVALEREADLLAVAARGEEALGLALGVVGHHGVGSVEDVPGRAVVLLELDRLGRGVILLEVKDVADVGPTPGVDRLVVVAHDHEVLALGGEQLADLVLGAVGVLVLVHRDVGKAVLVALEDVGVVAQQLVGVHEQVIEVHGVGALEALLQLLVDLGRHLVGRGRARLHEVVGVEQLVFG